MSHHNDPDADSKLEADYRRNCTFEGHCVGCTYPMDEDNYGGRTVAMGKVQRWCKDCWRELFCAKCSCCEDWYEKGAIGVDGLCWGCYEEQRAEEHSETLGDA